MGTAYGLPISQLTLRSEPQEATQSACRIISLTPAITEWIVEFLGEKRAKECLIARVDYANYPTWVENLESVGSSSQINIERILSLKPEVVLTQKTMSQESQVEKLRTLKLKVVVLQEDDPLNMDQNLNELGKALRLPSRSFELFKKWKSFVEQIKNKKQRKNLRFVIQVQQEPLILVGKNTFLSKLFENQGWINVAQGKSDYLTLSREALVNLKLDDYFVLSATQYKAQSIDQAQKFLQQIYPASKMPKVYGLDADQFSRCTFRFLNALNTLELENESH